MMALGEPIVYVVDDEAAARSAMESLLQSVGLRVETFGSAAEFLRRETSDAPCCLVLDVRLPGMSGIELQRSLTLTGANIPIIFITGHGDIPMSVEAMTVRSTTSIRGCPRRTSGTVTKPTCRWQVRKSRPRPSPVGPVVGRCRGDESYRAHCCGGSPWAGTSG